MDVPADRSRPTSAPTTPSHPPRGGPVAHVGGGPPGRPRRCPIGSRPVASAGWWPRWSSGSRSQACGRPGRPPRPGASQRYGGQTGPGVAGRLRPSRGRRQPGAARPRRRDPAGGAGWCGRPGAGSDPRRTGPRPRHGGPHAPPGLGPRRPPPPTRPEDPDRAGAVSEPASQAVRHLGQRDDLLLFWDQSGPRSPLAVRMSAVITGAIEMG
jgi:hypothetical protein